MEPINVYTALDVSVIEILLVMIIAFMGSFAHEYILFIKSGKRITLSVWINVFVSSFVTVIICLAIDPFIINIHPRMIFLPPLIIGLLGTELISKLSTISGSANILEYLLGFFGIERSDKTDPPTNPGEEPKYNQRHRRNRHNDDEDEDSISDEIKVDENQLLLEGIIYTENRIVKTMNDYKRFGNRTEFLKIFSNINITMTIIRYNVTRVYNPPRELTDGYRSLLDRYDELKELYNHIMEGYDLSDLR